MDRYGSLYAYLPDIGMAVSTESSLACDEKGNVLKFSVENAKWVSVASMENSNRTVDDGYVFLIEA